MRAILTTLSVIGFCLPCYASEITCQSDLKECFMLEGSKKDNCLYRVAENSTCEKTEAGKLASKRWNLASASVDGNTNSFFGPSSVDNSCLTSCDNQWLAFIVADESPSETSKHVSICLDGCMNSNKDLLNN